jgi:DNA-directed RNA polymerase specialized sigma24 family protein
VIADDVTGDRPTEDASTRDRSEKNASDATDAAQAAAFEELRPLLFSIAYRILGSVAEAEDAVQET